MASRNKTAGDPTGQRANRARTSKALEQRLDLARRQVLGVFRKIPKNRRSVTKVINADQQVVYDYDQNPEQREAMNNEIRAIISMQLLQTTGDSMPLNWWYRPQVELPTRQGTLEELNEFNRLITLAVAAELVGAGGMPPQRIAAEVVLSSQKYLQELRNVYVQNFQSIKSLSDTTASQVIQKINSGINAGSTPTNISEQITERFGVAKSNADRIARTEVNKAYNEARLRATDTAGEISGLKPLVRHISALLPKRTRRWHAARHYLVYTTSQQQAWWAEDANLVNCLCTTRTIIVDKDGNYIEA